MKEYAVRITVQHDSGSTTAQTHVRPENSRISKTDFVSMSLGRMLRMLSDWQDDQGLTVTGWTIVEVEV